METVIHRMMPVSAVFQPTDFIFYDRAVRRLSRTKRYATRAGFDVAVIAGATVLIPGR